MIKTTLKIEGMMSAGEHLNIGVISFAIGFSLMMVLDVALG